MKRTVKIILALFVAVASVTWTHAQVPAPAPATPTPGAPSFPPPPGTPTVRTGASFFSRPGLTNAVRPRSDTVPAVPAAPGATRPGFPAVPAAPGVATPGAPGVATPGGPGPLAPGTAVFAPGGGTNLAGVTNVIPKGLTNTIPAGTIYFENMPLDQVLRFYAELTGRTVLRSPQVPQNVTVSIRNQTELTRQEGIDALNTLLGLNGITMIDQGEKFIKAVPAATAGTEAPEFSETPREELPDSKKIVAQIVQLKNIAPEDVTAIIQPFASLQNSIIALKGSPVLILRDYAENVKRMLELIEKVDVAMPTSIDIVVIPIKYALASDVANVLSGLTAGGSTMTFGSSGGGPLGTTGGGGMTGFGGMGGGMNTGFGGNTMGGSMGMGGTMGRSGQYGSGSSFGARGMGTTGSGTSAFGTSRSGFGSRLDQAVRRATSAAGGGGAQGDIQLIGMAKIIADERSNALLVFADRTDLPMITNIISKLDVVLPQVEIEALILEVNIEDGLSLGVSMVQNAREAGKFTGAGGSLNHGASLPRPGSLTSLFNAATNAGFPGGFSYFGSYGNDFDFALTAAANDSRITVLSRPRIQTSTAQPATIFVGEQRPFITGSYFSDFGGVGSRSQYSLQDIGISLQVQPIVNQEGLVTMTIMQDISQVGGSTSIDGNEVPITIHRTANAYVSVHDRDTIVLGGFISTTKDKSASGVPFLKDIPGLGMLFRSANETVKRVELMVLIRPTVLPTPEAAALNAASERDRNPNIRRAEREEEQFSNRQLERLRKEEEREERKKYKNAQ